MLEVRDLACERGDVRLFSGLEFSLGEGGLLPEWAAHSHTAAVS